MLKLLLMSTPNTLLKVLLKSLLKSPLKLAVKSRLPLLFALWLKADTEETDR